MKLHQLIYNLKYPFLLGNHYDDSRRVDDSISFSTYNVFHKYFSFKVTSKSTQLPIFILPTILDNREVFTSDLEKTYIVPLTPSCTYYKRGYGVILRDAFCTPRGIGDIKKVTTPKGEEYYGGRGLLLDKDYNPLMALFFDVENVSTSNYARIKPVGLTVRVSPRVYSNQTQLMCKAIAQRVISIYSSLSIRTGGRGPMSSSERELPVRVIIEDMDYLVTTPRVPSINTDVDTQINEALVNNISLLTDNMEK